jgi:hypothetical protein
MVWMIILVTDDKIEDINILFYWRHFEPSIPQSGIPLRGTSEAEESLIRDHSPDFVLLLRARDDAANAASFCKSFGLIQLDR